MMNEFIFLLTTIFYMLCAIGVYKMGKVWLQAFLCMSYIVTLCITTKFFTLFGFTTSMGVVTFAGIFLATDMLTERYGKKIGYETVRITFLMTVCFVAITQLSLLTTSVSFAEPVASAMETLFNSSIRVMIAGFSVYLVSQHLDVWLYHFIHERTSGKHLWLRNNGSTVISQFIDTLLFFTAAFYGTMPNEQFVDVLITAYVIKACIALFDTPFIYLSKRIVPLDIKE